MSAGSKNFTYTGNVQSFTIPETEKWKLEVWGASGGRARTLGFHATGGLGGYSSGELTLESGQAIYEIGRAHV